MDDNDFQRLVYIGFGILGFFVVVLLAIVIDLILKVKKLSKELEEDIEDEELSNSGPQQEFGGSRPVSDNSIFTLPKPALTQPIKPFSGQIDSQSSRFHHEHNMRNDNSLSKFDYEDNNNRGAGRFRIPPSALKNPIHGSNDMLNNNNYNDDRRPNRPVARQESSYNNPGPRMNRNFDQFSDNGFSDELSFQKQRRDLQHNAYY